MFFRQVKVGGFDQNFSYLIGDIQTREIAIIDPDNCSLLQQIIQDESLKPQKILITHGHFDHVAGVAEMAQKYQIPALISQADLAIVENLKVDFQLLPVDGFLKVGQQEIEVMATPGHTSGSVSFLAAGKLISGDTLFVDGCGHCRSKGASIEDLFSSLQKIAKLDPALEIFPGHDYGPSPSSSLAQQLLSNPYLQALDDFEQFYALRNN